VIGGGGGEECQQTHCTAVVQKCDERGSVI
jgi:hypothetical protein